MKRKCYCANFLSSLAGHKVRAEIRPTPDLRLDVHHEAAGRGIPRRHGLPREPFLQVGRLGGGQVCIRWADFSISFNNNRYFHYKFTYLIAVSRP